MSDERRRPCIGRHECPRACSVSNTGRCALVDERVDLRAIRDAALALSRAVEPADLPPAARPALLVLCAHLAATGVDPVGDYDAADSRT